MISPKLPAFRLAISFAAAAACLLCWGFAHGSERTVTLVPDPEGTTETGEGQGRFRDVADNLFAADYREAYSYDAARVQLTYATQGATFTGRLVGTGLKPHLAYQVKFFAPNGTTAMVPIGRLGRWWASGNPLNVTDEFYEANQDTVAFDSFLVFDYFVTDAAGGVDRNLSLDSTYHVLYRTGPPGTPGVRARQENDGELIAATVAPSASADPDGDPSTPAPYDQDAVAETVEVYGEREHTGGNSRPLPGTAALEEGAYTVRLILTEEAFHAFGNDFGGNYASALRSPTGEDVGFTIAAGSASSGSDGAGGGGCFIATAVYGSVHHPVIGQLRGFRDRRLCVSPAGNAFVETYYAVSPTPAAYLRRSALLRCMGARVVGSWGRWAGQHSLGLGND